eukprot:scaffold1658_cov393-Prasinococcus_capsulatus_cf.AAC.6
MAGPAALGHVDNGEELGRPRVPKAAAAAATAAAAAAPTSGAQRPRPGARQRGPPALERLRCSKPRPPTLPFPKLRPRDPLQHRVGGGRCRREESGATSGAAHPTHVAAAPVYIAHCAKGPRLQR